MRILILSLISTFYFSTKAFAQDIIVKRSGEEITAKILEINSTNVRYKKFDFQDGPTYIIDKSELVMIKYPNGSKDNFMASPSSQTNSVEMDYVDKPAPVRTNNDMFNQPIDIFGYKYKIGYVNLSPKKVDQILLSKNDKTISSMIKSAKADKMASVILSFAPIPLGIASLTFLTLATPQYNINGTYNYNYNNDYLLFAGVFAAAAVTSGILATVKNVKNKKTRLKAVEMYNATYYRNSPNN